VAAKNILKLLQGEDRRTIGRADEVARLVSRNPRFFPKLVVGLWSEDSLIRMRAADAVEKVTRSMPRLLRSHKKELLGLMAETDQQELRWHLALMVPRLSLTAKERHYAVQVLEGYLEDHSSIVRTFALQGLADLARQEPSLRAGVVDLLRDSVRSGTPAMKARSRKLLARLDRS
jgi:hypothetical protein